MEDKYTNLPDQQHQREEEYLHLFPGTVFCLTPYKNLSPALGFYTNQEWFPSKEQ